jgi:Ca2+-binding EF-hand superfamily protein
MQPTPPGTAKPQRGGFFRALVKHRKAVEKGESFDGTVPAPQQPHPDSHGDPRAPSWSLQQRARSGAALFLEKLTLKFLEKLWVAIKKNFMLSTNGEIDVHNFMKLSHQQMPEFTEEDDMFLEQLFDRVDRRKKGQVRTTDIATAMILICKEDPITKLRLLFRVFDADDDSCLTPRDLRHVLQHQVQ